MKVDHLNALKNSVTEWLETLKVEEGRYDFRFSRTSGHSIFSSCFALFIYDLLGATTEFTEDTREDWANYIKSFQRPLDGLFEPNPVLHPNRERAIFQATCFCLSALRILGARPQYPLSVVKSWRGHEQVVRYLKDRGCHTGRPTSGNSAMFQAIMLTHEYERCGESWLRDSLDSWFAFHDTFKNSHGFWGQELTARYFHGVQNGFHQLVVYEYWQRDFKGFRKAVDAAMSLQDQWGFFSSRLGGSSCPDFDAVHLLVLAHHNGFRRNEIEPVLRRAVAAALMNQRDEGGFCESAIRAQNGASRLLNELRSLRAAGTPTIAYLRAKTFAYDRMRGRRQLSRKWVPQAQQLDEATLWDTWFRLLAIAEVTEALDRPGMFRFHDHIGLGYSQLAKATASSVLPPGCSQ